MNNVKNEKKNTRTQFCKPGGVRILSLIMDGKFVGFLITVQNFRQFALD
jgi:hypothetical protein